MLLKTLLRFPGLAPSPAALTGDPALDAYLIALDDRLLGGRGNRTVVVAELRDHLEERRDALVRAGHPAADAAARAVGAMGPPELHAAPERARVWRRAAVCFAIGLVLVGSLGLASDLPAGRPLGEILTARYAYTLIMALGLGWGLGFAYPWKALPTARRAARSYEVAYSSPLRWLLYVGTAFILAGSVGAVALLVTDAAPPIAPWGYSPPALALVLAICVAVLAGFHRCVVRRIEVSDEGLWIAPFTGRGFAVPWSAIVAIGDLGAGRTWLPPRGYWSSTYAITYRAASGNARRVYLWPEMANHELLAERVRAHVAGANG